MAKLPSVRIAVLIPAGPRDDALDTLASVVHYTDPSRVIVVIDDSGKHLARNNQIARLSSDIVVLPAVPARPGKSGGLWWKQAAGYRWILEHYQPGVILRLDADALFIGHGLEAEAEQVFASDPTIGLLGSYRVGPDGGIRTFTLARRRLRAETGVRGLLKPKRRASLRGYHALARSHGYVDGENTLGAASILSYAAVKAIYDKGWFGDQMLATSSLDDDHLLALVTVAAGFRLADFGDPDGPLAVRMYTLPDHPAELLAAGKVVVHSVRSWQDLTEPDIREFFAKSRQSGSCLD
jgi:hypothetical protein